jgi:hypothetical protein
VTPARGSISVMALNRHVTHHQDVDWVLRVADSGSSCGTLHRWLLCRIPSSSETVRNQRMFGTPLSRHLAGITGDERAVQQYGFVSCGE